MDTYHAFSEKLFLDELKAIYVVVPKTGCTSVKQHFSNLFNWRIATNVHDQNSEIYKHIDRIDITGPDFKDYFKFAFVRNPYSRLFSAYRSKVRPDLAEHPTLIDGVEKCFYEIGVRKEHSFKEFTKLVFSVPDFQVDPHIKSQHQFLRTESGKLTVDQTYYFENFEKYLKQLSQRLSIEGQIVFPHENRTQNNPYLYLEYYDHETIELVKSRYQLDFELFGYSEDISVPWSCHDEYL